jgi:hypothetical protein
LNSSQVKLAQLLGQIEAHGSWVDELVPRGMWSLYPLEVTFPVKRYEAVAGRGLLNPKLSGSSVAVTVPPPLRTKLRVSRSLVVRAPAGSACSRWVGDELIKIARSWAAAMSLTTLRVGPSSLLTTKVKFP